MTPGKSSFVQSAVNAVSKKRLENTVRTLAAIPTRHTLSGEKGADAAALWLESELKSYGGRLQVERDAWIQPPSGPRLREPIRIQNVYATLPGSVANAPYVLISGHYDSRVTDVMDAKNPAPGANDDASGVAVVLECARLLAGASLPLPILFAAVTGEEQSLLGSAHLARKLRAENKDVLAMATYDIVGNSRGDNGQRDYNHLRVFSAGWEPNEEERLIRGRRSTGTENETPARTLARATVDAARRYVRGFSLTLTLRNDRFGRGGDHSSFLAEGYTAAIRFTEPNENWSHQHQDLRTEKGIIYGDKPEFVDYPYLSRVARTAVAWVTELAAAPLPPARVRVKTELSANTSLSWDDSVGAAGYEILMRRTTDADWQPRSLLLPSTMREVTLPQSKDDYLFAIRAVSADGARGLPRVVGR